MSTYDAPLEFQEHGTAQPTVQPVWKEYTDVKTGKPYYSNGLTTTWTRPAELAPVAAAPVSTNALAKSADNGEPVRKKQKIPEPSPIEFSSKEEAVTAFKEMLVVNDTSPSLKWHEVAKMFAKDGQWKACESKLTTGERKQALAEYQTKRASELRQQERQEKVRNREAFSNMLMELIPKVHSFSPWNTQYEDVRDRIAADDRFYAVADETDRQNLFLDFCEEYRKREERRKRNVRRDAQDDFIAFLGEQQGKGALSTGSTWTSFVAALNEQERKDTRFLSSQHLSDVERHDFFTDFVMNLQATEEDIRRRKRDARRDSYREFLEDEARKTETIFPWSRWRDVEDIVSAHHSYTPLYQQDSEAPRLLFEDFVDEWQQRYRQDRPILSKLARLPVASDMPYEAFTNALVESAAGNTSMVCDIKGIISAEQPISNAKVYYHELLRQPSMIRRRRGKDYESSEDEGEIREDVEEEESEPSVSRESKTSPAIEATSTD